jgi:ABC-2 type transport system permease protein
MQARAERHGGETGRKKERAELAATLFRERSFGPVNWLGFWTLYLREVRRFTKVYTQTLLAPMATTLLYLVVFLLALGGGARTAGGVPYGEFLAPGLIMMTMVQNAFANTSSSIVIAKVQGNIVDLLMPPLSAGELSVALALGGVTRGLMVGAALLPVMMIFVDIHIAHWGAVLFFGFFASLLLSCIGILGGIWAEKFDHMAAVTNFIIVPLSFLSGTFYSIDRLPESWRLAASFNPFFYMIDGFRYGFIGRADSSIGLGMAVVAGFALALLAVSWRLFATGWRLKA